MFEDFLMVDEFCKVSHLGPAAERNVQTDNANPDPQKIGADISPEKLNSPKLPSP